MRGSWMMALCGIALSGSVAFAQGKAPPKKSKAEPQKQAKVEKPGKPAKPEIPSSHKPPAGLCRIWLNGVPAALQPAPTDCASAVRNRPGNARVIFPEEKEAPPVKMLSPSRSLEIPRRAGPGKPRVSPPRAGPPPPPTRTPPVRKTPPVKKPHDPAR